MHPEIIMGNSYDGTSQVYMMMGAYRLICSNGMIIGVTFGKFNNRHSVYNPNVKQLDTVLPDMPIVPSVELAFLKSTIVPSALCLLITKQVPLALVIVTKPLGSK